MNRQDTERKTRLRDYILHRLSEEEDLEIETAMTLDSEYRLDHEECREELEREYLRGQLEPEEKEQFERFCLATPYDKASLALTQEMSRLAAEHRERLSATVEVEQPAKPVVPKIGFFERIQAWLGPLRQPVPALVAAGFVLAVALNVWVAQRLRSSAGELAEARARVSGAETELQETNRTIEGLRSQIQGFSRTLALAIPLDLVSRPRGTRGPGAIEVPPVEQYGSISLVVAVGIAGQETYPSYGARILADGREQWASPQARAVTVGDYECLVLSVPSSALKPAGQPPPSLTLEISGITASGERRLGPGIPLLLKRENTP